MTETQDAQMPRKKLALAVIAAAVVGAGLVTIAGIFFSRGADWGPEPGQFHSSRDGFAIKFPAEWDTKQDYMGCAVIGLSPLEPGGDTFRENVNVIVTSVPRGTTAGEFCEAQRPMMSKMLTQFAEGEKSNITVGGDAAVRQIYSHVMGEYRLSVVCYMLTQGERGYVITCTATDASASEWLPKLEAVAATFRAD